MIPSQGSLYVTPSVIAFRQRAEAASGDMGLFVQGNYAGHLSNLQGTLRLVAGDDGLIDEVHCQGEPSLHLTSLRITEINYNPHAPTVAETAAGFGDNNDFEFIELLNMRAEPLELAGVEFVDGIRFAFPQGTLGPNEQALLVRNRGAFETRYGTDLPVVGRYDGSLSGGGERLVWSDPFGEPIADFRYDDGNGWPPQADGGGPTLELTDPASQPSTEPQRMAFLEDPVHWQASAVPGGSPGRLSQPTGPAEVIARHVFYNHSSFDGGNPGANLQDDSAVATDKQALLPGQTATFLNYTSCVRGINGILVDVVGLAATPTTDDFAFRVGNDDDPAHWPSAPNPLDVTVRADAGVEGSTRVTIVWPDFAIVGQWLQVEILATDGTGLAAGDVFYFGNAVGEAGDSTANAIVNTTDEVAARNFQHGPSRLVVANRAIRRQRSHAADGGVSQTGHRRPADGNLAMIIGLHLGSRP